MIVSTLSSLDHRQTTVYLLPTESLESSEEESLTNCSSPIGSKREQCACRDWPGPIGLSSETCFHRPSHQAHQLLPLDHCSFASCSTSLCALFVHLYIVLGGVVSKYPRPSHLSPGLPSIVTPPHSCHCHFSRPAHSLKHGITHCTDHGTSTT